MKGAAGYARHVRARRDEAIEESVHDAAVLAHQRMLRATPIMIAALTRLAAPSRYAVTVAVSPMPSTNPATTPATRKLPGQLVESPVEPKRAVHIGQPSAPARHRRVQQKHRRMQQLQHLASELSGRDLSCELHDG